MANRRKLKDIHETDKPKKPSKLVLAVRKLMMTRGWKLYGPGSCLLVSACIVFVIGLVLDGHWNTRLSEREAELQAQVDIAESEAAQKDAETGGREEASTEGTVANQSRRRTLDDMTISDMISHATTWDSRRSYETSRNELLAHYEWLTEETNPEFLLKFFPSAENAYVKLDGMIISDPLEDGRNISFSSLTSYLLEERDDGSRLYFAEATVQSRGQVGGISDAHMAMTYETRSDGSVWYLKCYTV